MSQVTHVRIPMRDGIHLHASVHLPRQGTAPSPVILTLTPYTADMCHSDGVYFASRGLPFVAVDVRGRGESQGVFRPFIQEAQDGHDVVEWLARQPCCNGKVAMWGSSYLGHAQWVTAAQFPPHLCTIIPTAAPHLGTDFPMRGNIFYPYLVQWLMLTNGRASQTRMFADNAFWSEIFREWHESGRPFRHVDAVSGNPAPVFQEWLTHPEPDEYWDAFNPTIEQYGRLGIPILTITGSYDDDQPGALEHYRQHVRHASAAARALHYLIIGPWDHTGTVTPRAEVGGLKLGPASLVDLSRLRLEWYAWTLQNGPKPELLKKQVAYYVMGAECWRYADTLDGVTGATEIWFLSSRGDANDVFSAGSLSATPGHGPPDTYTYDPRDTQGPEVDAEARLDAGSLVDQTVTLALRGRQFVYQSAPFSANTEISGFFRLSLWIAIDRPDTDFYVSVHEISPDGGSILLSTDAMRARYREGLRAPKLICTRAPLRYDFERFTFISRQVRTGHRLRLVIAPVGRVIYASFTQKNYHGGGVVAEESATDGAPVRATLFHDREHPSVLFVPVGGSRSK